MAFVESQHEKREFDLTNDEKPSLMENETVEFRFCEVFQIFLGEWKLFSLAAAIVFLGALLFFNSVPRKYDAKTYFVFTGSRAALMLLWQSGHIGADIEALNWDKSRSGLLRSSYNVSESENGELVIRFTTLSVKDAVQASRMLVDRLIPRLEEFYSLNIESYKTRLAEQNCDVVSVQVLYGIVPATSLSFCNKIRENLRFNEQLKAGDWNRRLPVEAGRNLNVVPRLHSQRVFTSALFLALISGFTIVAFRVATRRA